MAEEPGSGTVSARPDRFALRLLLWALLELVPASLIIAAGMLAVVWR